MKWFYEIVYKYFKAPWDIGEREELVNLVESGRIKPCRTIDLGCGTASNCIFLAQKGFDVTGIDFAKSAIELGRSRAKEAGVSVNFLVDNLTDIKNVEGVFDFLVDYGTLDDLNNKDRNLYIKNILPLTNPGSKFLLYAFEWPVRWWEQPFYSSIALDPGEVENRFSPYFEIETISKKLNKKGFPLGWAVYLMERKGELS